VTLEVVRDGRTDGQRIAHTRTRTAQAPGTYLFCLLVTERINLDTADSNLPPLRIEFIKNGEQQPASASGQGISWIVSGAAFTTVALCMIG